MSYFSPDVIILILGPWFGIFYYSVDLWWVSDSVWGRGFTRAAVAYNREESKSGVLVVLPSCGAAGYTFFKGG